MKNTEKLGLTSPYTSVKTDSGSSFGGSQMWFGFSRENRKRLDKFKEANVIRAFGCGLIAACDIFDYLSRKEGSASASSGVYTEKEYEDYIYRMNREYFHTRYYFGVTGFKLARKMNKLLKKLKTGYKASWGVGADVLPAKIEEMLTNDIPVLISIGPAIFKKKELSFYSATEKDGELVFKSSTHTKDHYVTVTGMYDDGEKIMLEISSWGRRYYIDFDEYTTYVKENDNTLFSNILYIEAKEK